eukprot:GHVT01076136.1.p1 GENE.GHVT01076136.1~~GHVT01076136.1.p1  ORF type:complete len:682 (+),score=29.74 GHVT01076136.1:234-2279(+)
MAFSPCLIMPRMVGLSSIFVSFGVLFSSAVYAHVEHLPRDTRRRLLGGHPSFGISHVMRQSRFGAPGALPKYPQPTIIGVENIENTSADHVCPFGTVRAGNQCIMLEKVPALMGCADGWTHDKAGGTCYGFEVEPAAEMCDDGYLPDPLSPNSRCVRSEELPLEIGCPIGYMLEGTDSCVRPIELLPNFTCPPSKRYQGGKCVGVDMYPAQCPPSSVSEGEYCKREKQVPATPFCPPGDGFVYVDGRCVRKVVNSIRLECPPGGQFRLAGDLCVAEIEAVPEPEPCHENMLGPTGLLHQALHVQSVSPLGLLPEAPPPAMSCQKCPAGCLYRGGQANICICKKVLPALQNCDEGFQISPAGCFKEHEAAPTMTCPDNFDYDLVLGFCRQTVRFPISGECVPYRFQDGQCLRPIEVDATPYCLSPMELTYAGQDQTIAKCVGFDRLPLQTQGCPTGSVPAPGGRHACISEARRPRRPRCPTDMTLRGELCTKEVTAIETFKCPFGFEFHPPAVCVHQHAINPAGICPPGFYYDRIQSNCFRQTQEYEFESALPIELLPVWRQDAPKILAKLRQRREMGPISAAKPRDGTELPASSTTAASFATGTAASTAGSIDLIDEGESTKTNDTLPASDTSTDDLSSHAFTSAPVNIDLSELLRGSGGQNHNVSEDSSVFGPSMKLPAV